MMAIRLPTEVAAPLEGATATVLAGFETVATVTAPLGAATV